MFVQIWNTRLYESPRARFYRCIISDHKFHFFVDNIPIAKHRNAFIRLIVSSHRLRVETGRWQRPVIPYEQRLCENCGRLDDEYHLLLECQKYHELRLRYIPPYYRIRPSMLKCTQLVNSHQKKTLQNMSKFVFECFQLNSQSLR